MEVIIWVRKKKQDNFRAENHFVDRVDLNNEVLL